MTDQEYADWIARQQCSQCNEPFSIEEWDDRHTDDDGGDCHARCCPLCARKDERLAAGAKADLEIGDMVTVLVPNGERHINDLWWWDGARCKVTAIHDGKCSVLTTDGYQGWLDRRMLVKRDILTTQTGAGKSHAGALMAKLVQP